MIRNLKSKLNMNSFTIGSWITIGDESITEILAQRGFDWLTIDMEHSAITLDIAQRMIRVIDAYNVSALVRVGEKNANLIKRVMDAGASGVIVPNVKNVEEAENAVKSVKYPPLGFRGVGLARAQRYGFGFEEYKKEVQDKAVVIVQIEHVDGIKNLESILSVEGVDGSMIGPYDLSASLAIPGDLNNPKVLDQINKYVNVCKRMNKPAGMHVIPPDIKEVHEKKNKGFSFIAFSLDTLFLGKKIDDELGEM